MGMDGLNNAVIPGYATPEQYTKEITIANDGVVNKPLYMHMRSIVSQPFNSSINGVLSLKKMRLANLQ